MCVCVCHQHHHLQGTISFVWFLFVNDTTQQVLANFKEATEDAMLVDAIHTIIIIIIIFSFYNKPIIVRIVASSFENETPPLEKETRVRWMRNVTERFASVETEIWVKVESSYWRPWGGGVTAS